MPAMANATIWPRSVIQTHSSPDSEQPLEGGSMKQNGKAFGGMLLVLIFSSACSNTVRVTYYSDPAGAALYEGEQFFGYTPVSLDYQVKSEMKKTGCAVLRPTAVRWASGAEAAITSMNVCAINGTTQQFTFVRPTGVPGRELDVQFAIEKERNAILAAQANAQRDLATIQALESLGQPTTSPQASMQCTTRVVRDTIYTDCH